MTRPILWLAALGTSLLVAGTAVPRGQSSGATSYVVLSVRDMTQDHVHLGVIAVDTSADADTIRRKLQSGESFEALARQYSRHPSAVIGGDFGSFSIAELPPSFRSALQGARSGEYSPVIAVQTQPGPPGWPTGVPVPGTSLKDIELALGQPYSSEVLPADGQSSMTEVMYAFGLRLRVHETRGVGFMEFTPPWKTTIFGIRPDDQLPSSMLDLFPYNGRFVRGVPVAVPQHRNWFVDVDDRVDAVSRVLFVDPAIYGNLPGVPKGN